MIYGAYCFVVITAARMYNNVGPQPGFPEYRSLRRVRNLILLGVHSMLPAQDSYEGHWTRITEPVGGRLFMT
ncbi:hypothetical protein HN51_066612 [Arachis hypogaea]